MPSIRKLACKEFLEGLEILNLPLDRIPTLKELNDAITPNSGWKVVRTPVRYSDAVPWYEAFANKQFMVTDYMRTWEELEFTPEPDMFHDIFGHLPFMALRRYAELQEMFAPTFQRANKEQRENIKRLAWFSTEFGLIRQNGELKVFGTGLLSSIGEIENVMSRKVPIMSFTIENVLNYDKAIYNFNEALFAFDSLTDLKSELASYFNSI
jgi:phenylalanine-4-hydroxylase